MDHDRRDCRPGSPARRWGSNGRVGTRPGDPPDIAAAREGLGRSRGGLTSKIHAACDALGNPLRLVITPGQRGDMTQASALIDAMETGAVIGDKGYDSDALVEQIESAGAVAVIPSRKNRTVARDHDANLYADRNKIERFFGRLKQCRRVATRYEKPGQNYLSMVFLASALISLK